MAISQGEVNTLLSNLRSDMSHMRCKHKSKQSPESPPRSARRVVRLRRDLYRPVGADGRHRRGGDVTGGDGTARGLLPASGRRTSGLGGLSPGDDRRPARALRLSSLSSHVSWTRCAGFCGMIPPTMEALERSLVLDVIDAGVAVTWCIPAAMSLRDIAAI